MNDYHTQVGDIVRANNRTFGLRPAREAGPEEVVTEITYTGVVTADGNRYDAADYTLVRKGSS